MNRTQKEKIVQQLAKDLENKHVYFTNSQGLSAQEVASLRHTCFHAGIRYQNVKNTLLFKALQKLKWTDKDLDTIKDSVLKESTSLFFIEDNASEPARILQKIHKDTKQKRPALKAAYVYEDLFLGQDKLSALTQLKSKEELIATVVQTLQSPTHNLLSALKSNGSKLAGALKTIKDKASNTTTS